MPASLRLAAALAAASVVAPPAAAQPTAKACSLTAREVYAQAAPGVVEVVASAGRPRDLPRAAMTDRLS